MFGARSASVGASAVHFGQRQGGGKLDGIRIIVGDPHGIKGLTSQKASAVIDEGGTRLVSDNIGSIIEAVQEAITRRAIVFLDSSVLRTNGNLIERLSQARGSKEIPILIYGDNPVSVPPGINIIGREGNLVKKIQKLLASN